MGNFKQDRKRFGGRGGGRDGRKPERHKATCGKCGVNCEVPFRPTGERPVLCSNCFRNQGNGGGGANKFGNKRRERPNFGDKQMHNVVCVKCGENCQVPFKPTAGKPVFCDNCFKQDGGGKSGGDGSKNFGEIMEQINLLNTKIDKLIEALAPKTPTKKETKKVTNKKKGKVKTKTVKKKASVKKKK